MTRPGGRPDGTCSTPANRRSRPSRHPGGRARSSVAVTTSTGWLVSHRPGTSSAWERRSPALRSGWPSRPADTLDREDRKTREGQTRTKGYATQAERFQKQRRLQYLRAELGRVMADRDAKLARVVDGGKRLAKTRHNLSTAGLAEAEWRERWSCARWRIEANGSGDEPFGNLTITVTPYRRSQPAAPEATRTPGQRQTRQVRPLRPGEVRLPRGRVAGPHHRRKVRLLRASPASQAVPASTSLPPGPPPLRPSASTAGTADGECCAAGPVVAVDLNAGSPGLSAASTPTETPSVAPAASISASPEPLPGAMPRSGTRSHGSSATACGTAPAPSPSKTSISPMRGRLAGRRWAAAGAASGSVAPSPASPPQSSATGLPGRLADTASACSRSTPPTRRRGEVSTGASRTRTSPATRQPPP